MRYKLTTIAIAALLIISVGTALAAATTTTSADESLQNEVIPENHDVSVVDPHEALTAADVNAAVETAWSSDEMMNYFDDDEAIHFEVWAPQSDEQRAIVSLAPAEESDQTQVLANVHFESEHIIDIKEPHTLNESTMQSIEQTDDDHTTDGGPQHEQIESQQGTLSESTDHNTTAIKIETETVDTPEIALQEDDQKQIVATDN
ncbi:hypothetical protein C482_14239 [Natrialba chahannaoensis JCM 10990]|uniref:Uncharacterized protein n=2 Tax=Natrialba chahannaoensis TaxID=68911 RepID=M0AEA7_9EURY|nr:hypothetical protein C482_14239 [Natrialba chahannaoensis JCM 10990]